MNCQKQPKKLFRREKKISSKNFFAQQKISDGNFRKDRDGKKSAEHRRKFPRESLTPKQDSCQQFPKDSLTPKRNFRQKKISQRQLDAEFLQKNEIAIVVEDKISAEERIKETRRVIVENNSRRRQISAEESDAVVEEEIAVEEIVVV